MLPRDQFQIFGLENFDGPLCTGGCKKLVYMAEILVTLSVLREPARIFLNKMCSFDVTDFEKTLLVTLYVSDWQTQGKILVLSYFDSYFDKLKVVTHIMQF